MCVIRSLFSPFPYKVSFNMKKFFNLMVGMKDSTKWDILFLLVNYFITTLQRILYEQIYFQSQLDLCWFSEITTIWSTIDTCGISRMIWSGQVARKNLDVCPNVQVILERRVIYTGSSTGLSSSTRTQTEIARHVQFF